MAADEIEKTVIYEELDHTVGGYTESTAPTAYAPGWGSFAPERGVYIMPVSECDHMLPYVTIHSEDFGLPLVIELDS